MNDPKVIKHTLHIYIEYRKIEYLIKIHVDFHSFLKHLTYL